MMGLGAVAPADEAACQKIEDLLTTIGTAVDTFILEECANYFQAAGYEPV